MVKLEFDKWDVLIGSIAIFVTMSILFLIILNVVEQTSYPRLWCAEQKLGIRHFSDGPTKITKETCDFILSDEFLDDALEAMNTG